MSLILAATGEMEVYECPCGGMHTEVGNEDESPIKCLLKKSIAAYFDK